MTHSSKDISIPTSGNTIVGSTTNTINTISHTMSHAADIFRHLTVEQKAKYFKDQYGTVKGMTGFFDYWFKQGIKDTKSFVSPDGTIIDACIVLEGGSYEGGGWIKMDTEAKTIVLYGSSGSYGKVPEEYKKLLLDVMSKSYPEYTISLG